MASTTLSRGYKSPNSPDTGAIFFPDITTDIQQMNDHTHNGADGAPMGKVQTVSSGSWGTADSNGRYSQVITLPTYTNGAISYQLKFDEVQIDLRLASTQEAVYGKIVKASTNSYTVYTNDNTVSFTAVYI